MECLSLSDGYYKEIMFYVFENKRESEFFEYEFYIEEDKISLLILRSC